MQAFAQARGARFPARAHWLASLALPRVLDAFLAWSVPNSLVQYAHCPRCGNLDVRRISREYVTGPFAWLFGKLGLPAYRCAPCRYKFFTIRRHLRIVPAPQSPAPEAESSSSPPR